MKEALAGAEGFALAMYTLIFIGSHASINGRQRNGTPDRAVSAGTAPACVGLGLF
jgi:hypothetical protein